MAWKATHGMSNTRLYGIHRAMKQRCYSLNFAGYKYYGAKGIEMCDLWKNELSEFMEWALSNGYTDELTIDRIDATGNYEPSNCRWITQHEQILNQDRNSDRTANDKHLKQRADGKWTFIFYRSIDGKQRNIISVTGEDRTEAEYYREKFLETDDTKYVKQLRKMVARSMWKYQPKNNRKEPTKDIGFVLSILEKYNIKTAQFVQEIGTTRQNLSLWVQNSKISKPMLKVVVDFINTNTDELISISTLLEKQREVA